MTLRLRGWVPFLLLLAGCAGSEDQWTKNRPQVYPASGVVTYRGVPLEDASVVFRPSAGEPPAYDLTDAEGRFALTTFDTSDGAVAGPHEVRITKTKVEQAAPAHPEGPLPPRTEKSLIPERYGDFETSGLTATISESGPNEFTFELTE